MVGPVEMGFSPKSSSESGTTNKIKQKIDLDRQMTDLA